MSDQLIQDLTKLIESKVTPDNYDIQDSSSFWARTIAQYLHDENLVVDSSDTKEFNGETPFIHLPSGSAVSSRAKATALIIKEDGFTPKKGQSVLAGEKRSSAKPAFIIKVDEKTGDTFIDFDLD